MPYTVKYLGYEVSCSSPEELHALLGQNVNQPKSVPPISPAATNHHSAQTSQMAALLAKLEGKSRELLRYLAANGTVSRDRLTQAVGVPDPRQFGGLLISISKYAEGIGTDSPIERMKARANGNGQRSYHYKLRDAVSDEVKQALLGH